MCIISRKMIQVSQVPNLRNLNSEFYRLQGINRQNCVKEGAIFF